mmetsp:Transcript_9637/g.23693  ORF Transcript_9637/g.23693 Transcript_9637/m.23693 type:complete len:520 (+) Transcript_9637:264-1823(+)|eukprot:CAMPEP_0179002798 /NCGR_PEP_ID=MMETSP0795-20121207/12270_1 /TAXON_ID=88552 /ORGANISM="Amoebophrya sp., Strain Ameob2" /LENGTH=519 /DNA_ID=CAMNT_0020696631 /DNA_START=254 /DNA_END=1813 /DNA_ORIENTATION=+
MEFVNVDRDLARIASACSICLGAVALDFVETGCCGDLCCAICEKKHRDSFTENGNNRTVTCFKCRRLNYTVVRSLAMERLLNDEEVRCLACRKTMKRKAFAAHIAIEQDGDFSAPAIDGEDSSASSASSTDAFNQRVLERERMILHWGTLQLRECDQFQCTEILRPCPNKARGCTFTGKLRELKTHLHSECVKGYRLLDEEAVRISGGEARIKKNCDSIRSLLGRGGGSGAGAPPISPKCLLQHVHAAQTYITSKEYFRLSAAIMGAGGGRDASAKSGTGAGEHPPANSSGVAGGGPVATATSSNGAASSSGRQVAAAYLALSSNNSVSTSIAPAPAPAVSSGNATNIAPVLVPAAAGRDDLQVASTSALLQHGPLAAGCIFASAAPDARESDRKTLLEDYRKVLKSLVVDSWNLKSPSDRQTPDAITKEGVKRQARIAESDLQTTDETWRKIYFEDLPAEKPPPRAPSPPRSSPCSNEDRNGPYGGANKGGGKWKGGKKGKGGKKYGGKGKYNNNGYW